MCCAIVGLFVQGCWVCVFEYGFELFVGWFVNVVAFVCLSKVSCAVVVGLSDAVVFMWFIEAVC